MSTDVKEQETEEQEQQEEQEIEEQEEQIDPQSFRKLREEVDRLRKHSETLIEEKRKQQDRAKEAAEKAEMAEREAAKRSGDIESLEKSWKKKLSDREEELRQEMEQVNGWVKDLTVGQTATAIASELALQGSAKALLPHIKARLGTDIRDGRPTTVILDEDGKTSALTLEDLKKEFRNDPAFAPLIVGSKASGSGGGSGKPASGGKSISREELDKMTPKDKAKFYKQNPDIKVIDQS